MSVVGAFGEPGYFTATTAGSGTITATLNGVTQTAPITVDAATLVSLAVSPKYLALFSGNTPTQLTCTATFSDDTTQDVTSLATWASSDSAIATVNASGQAHALTTGIAIFTASWNSLSDTAQAYCVNSNPPPDTNPSLIQVSPPAPSVQWGATQQFVATGLYSDGHTYDITGLVTWVSGTPAFATIDAQGLATPVHAGLTEIRATLNGVAGLGDLLVVPPADIVLDPISIACLPGVIQQFKAYAFHADGSKVEITSRCAWASADTSIGTMSNTGLMTAVAAGNTKLAAGFFGVAGFAALLVYPQLPVPPEPPWQPTSIQLMPSSETIYQNVPRPVYAIATYPGGVTYDVSGLCTWSVSGTALTKTGDYLTAVVDGVATVTATLAGVSGSGSFRAVMIESVAVTPAQVSMTTGSVQGFLATGTYSDGTPLDLSLSATWFLSDTGLASLIDTNFVQANAVGTLAVRATQYGLQGQALIQITQGIIYHPGTPMAPVANPFQPNRPAYAYNSNLGVPITNDTQDVLTNQNIVALYNAVNGLSGNTTLSLAFQEQLAFMLSEI